MNSPLTSNNNYFSHVLWKIHNWLVFYCMSRCVRQLCKVIENNSDNSSSSWCIQADKTFVFIKLRDVLCFNQNSIYLVRQFLKLQLSLQFVFARFQYLVWFISKAFLVFQHFPIQYFLPRKKWGKLDIKAILHYYFNAISFAPRMNGEKCFLFPPSITIWFVIFGEGNEKMW